MSVLHNASPQTPSKTTTDAQASGAGSRRPGKRVGRFVLVALVVHAEILLLVGVGLYWLAPRDADVQARLAAAKAQQDSQSIDVGMLDDETAQRILADLERREEEAKAEAVKKEVESVKAPGQVVDVPAPREEKRPDKANFASEHDTSTPMETRKYGKFDEKARQGDTLGSADESRPERQATPQAAGEPARQAAPSSPLAMKERSHAPPGRNAPRVSPAPPGHETGAPDLQPPSADGMLSPLGNLQMRLGSEGSRNGPAPGSLALTPSFAQLARAVGSGTQDALKDIEEGDETALNSKKWRFAAFFNRVKHQVQEHWHPDDVYRRRDPTGAINGRTNRLTIVRVQLNPNGNLANVALESPSGLEYLDDEAIQAFRAAQPFPNPPRQLIDASDGLISFQFGFLFEISGVSRPMLFKYNM